MPAKKAAKKRTRQTGMTPRQRAFVREYLKDFNGKQAAIRAGYAAHSAEVTASKLLRVPKVAAAVAKGGARAADKAEVTVDWIVQGLQEVADCDVTAVARWNDRGEVVFTRFEDVPPEIRRCISEIRQGEDKFGRPFPIVKFYDKNEARKLLGQYRGMFTKKVELEAGERTTNLLVKAQELLAAKRQREGQGGGDGQ